MISRQPDSTPPGRPRVLPLTLLIIGGLAGLYGLAGLKGKVAGPRWDGPLHRDAVVVGLVLELVLGITLVIAIRLVTKARAGTAGAASASAAPASAVAVRLRWVLVFLVGAGIIATALTMLVGQHQHLFSGSGSARPGQAASASPSSSATRPGGHSLFTFHLHLHVPAVLLYGLLALTFLGGTGVRMWWVRQFRPPGRFRAHNYIAEDPQDLREAVRAGRSALRAIDEARAAIIACYLAMEASLAERGTARANADTPDELLRRATATGIVRGTAAGRLTALFYEARFSSHPMDRGQRDAAERALGELVAALAGAGPAWIPARRRWGNRSGARA